MGGTTSRDGHYDPLELLTLDEVSALIRRSRRALTEDVAAGRLRIVKLGRSTRVPRAELERYIAEASGYDGPTPIDRGGTS
jgi:excisionase family DNA binding protein